jgi:hypothetical protein
MTMNIGMTTASYAVCVNAALVERASSFEMTIFFAPTATKRLMISAARPAIKVSNLVLKGRGYFTDMSLFIVLIGIKCWQVLIFLVIVCFVYFSAIWFVRKLN